MELPSPNANPIVLREFLSAEGMGWTQFATERWVVVRRAGYLREGLVTKTRPKNGAIEKEEKDA
jgi:hypothetical protein